MSLLKIKLFMDHPHSSAKNAPFKIVIHLFTMLFCQPFILVMVPSLSFCPHVTHSCFTVQKTCCEAKRFSKNVILYMKKLKQAVDRGLFHIHLCIRQLSPRQQIDLFSLIIPPLSFWAHQGSSVAVYAFVFTQLALCLSVDFFPGENRRCMLIRNQFFMHVF